MLMEVPFLTLRNITRSRVPAQLCRGSGIHWSRWRHSSCLKVLRESLEAKVQNCIKNKLAGKLRLRWYGEGFILHYVEGMLHPGEADFLGEAACARAPGRGSAQRVLDVLHGNSALFSHLQLAVVVKIQYLTWQGFIYLPKVWKLIKLLSKSFGSTAAAWLVPSSWPYRKTEHPRDPNFTAALIDLHSKTLL